MNKKLSHYELLEEIGLGGMGRVCKAYDTMLDRTVVLKLLAPDLMSEEESRKRFLREARLASALDHPNICTIYEIAEVDNQYFIAMQYIPGKTLKKVIGSKPLSLDTVFSIALQVGDALAAAHAKGIVHRDIKSSNIIITPGGKAKVLDFGLAKLLSDKGRVEVEAQADELTRLGTPMGTPSYMSPELANGERADHRSDIFSFGVVVYEMATGKLPFRGQTSVDVMHAVLHEAHKPAIEINDKLVPDMSAIIDNAIAKKPADRYQSMAPMLEDLQRLSVALRFGAQGVPDGLTTPFVVPKRQSSRGVFGQMIRGLLSRAPASETQTALQPVQSPREATSRDGASLASVSARKTLAVLPFRNLSGDAASDFYALSLADGLTTELAAIGSLAVTPSSAVSKYRDQAIDPARVRSALGVDVVLMGNFLKFGDRIRVTAQLIDTNNGAILWSEKIDADAVDVLAIQDQISQRVIAGLSGGQAPLDPTHLLKDENEAVRLDAVRTLEFSHDPRALAALVEAVRDPSLKVKAEAVDGVVKLGAQATGPVIRLLNDAIDEADNLTARYAAKALGLIGDRSISSVLVELLRSEDKFVACEAALALGRLSEVRAVPDLIGLLDQSNGNIRFAAAEALGQISDPIARQALERRLNDDDEGVRAKARWALSKLKKVASRTAMAK
ncbi:MAG TPA: protein kinase [Blastocatellia bacterium]|nr:protein kinase [Blastocatellia bacterium]